MTVTRTPSDVRMRAWRLAGKFICTCAIPRPRRWGAFGAVECQQCFKPVLNRESVAEVIALAEGEL